jgi:hypothetical protein
MSICLKHGGGSMRILSPSVFMYISDIHASNIVVDLNDISKRKVKQFLNQVDLILLYN